MVSNPQTATAHSDVLSALVYSRGGKPIRLDDLSEDEVMGMFESARPHGGRRRDGYFMSLQRQWWINLLYYLGIQELEVPEILENIDPNLLAQKASYIANHVMRLVLSNVGRLTSAKVDWSVVPNTPDQADQEGARVAQHLLDYLHKYLNLSRKRMEAAMWLDICGTAFVHSDWDGSKGEMRRFYYDPMTSQPILQAQLQPGQQQWLDKLGMFEDKSDGDYDVEVLSPFQVIVPPRFKELERMPWVLIRRVMSIDEVWDRWPDKAPDIGPEDIGIQLTGQYWNRLSTLTRRPGLGLGVANENDDAVIVDAIWYAPSKRCPEGMTAYATKRMLLESGPHKYHAAGLDTRFPLVDLHNIRMPGRFHSMSTVEHLIGPQQEYNRARQQIIAQRDILSVPQWIAPIGALSKGIVRNEIGDVVEFNPRVGRPELVQPPKLGDAQLVSGSQATSDMQMISSFSDASLGNMPQGARSGNAVAMLQERDQQGIAPTVAELEASFENWGTQLLKLSWKFMKIPRTIQIYGESRQSDIRYFKGADLNGNCRVTVRAGSMTPKSKAATIELLSNLMQLGAINPADPRQQRLVLEAVEVGGAEKLYQLEDGSRRRARIENLMFLKPDPSPTFAFPDVKWFDDHQAHYEEHLAFMQTDAYELMDPMLKVMFEAHVNKHIGFVADMMMAQQMAASGGGPGGGGGSPEAKPLGKASPPRQNAAESKSNP